MKIPSASVPMLLAVPSSTAEIAVGKRDPGGAQLLGERHVGGAAGSRGDERIGAGGAQLGEDRRPIAAVHRQIFFADDLAALLLDIGASELEHAAAKGVVAADQKEALGVVRLHEVIDNRRHLLLGHPGIDIEVGIARTPFIERGVDEGGFSALNQRQAGVARRAGLHADECVNLFLEDQRVEGLLRASRARAVVGHFERKRAAENSTRLVDLFHRKLGGLNDRRRNDTVGTGKTDRNSDLNRALGQCWRSQ